MLRNFLTRSGMVLAAIAALAVGPPSAQAQFARCAERSEVVDWLAERFSERQSGFGLIGTQAMLELFTSEKGTWTVVVTDVARRTCMVAAGDSWVDVEPAPVQSQLDH